MVILMTKYIVAKQIKSGDWKGFWTVFKGNTILCKRRFTSKSGAMAYAQDIRKAIKYGYFNKWLF
ncbi:hypothetical protein DSECCO2_664470 [anaerobic digester metagenome]